MPNNLEEYLKNRRESLDVEVPDDSSVWNRIEARIRENEPHASVRKKSFRLITFRNIAAAAIVMFCLGYITKDLIDTLAAKRTVTLSSIDNRLGEREDHYRHLVNVRTNDVKMLRGTDNTVVSELFSELVRLDTIYMQSMADLRELGPNEKIINTIFDTYENKIRILELIILETNRMQIHENNEKVKL